MWSVKLHAFIFCNKTKSHSLMYLAGFLLLADVLGLLMFLGPLRQVGVVGQATEQGGHLGPRVHLLLLRKKKGKKRRTDCQKDTGHTVVSREPPTNQMLIYFRLWFSNTLANNEPRLGSFIFIQGLNTKEGIGTYLVNVSQL